MSSGRTFADYLTGELPACVQIPPNVPADELVRWKLPRDVFQDLFIEKSDRLDSLDPITLHYLNRWRSLENLAQSLRHNHLIIYNYYTYHASLSIVRRTVVPCPGALFMSSCPLHNNARSRIPTTP